MDDKYLQKLKELALAAKQMQVNDCVKKQMDMILESVENRKKKYAEILKEYYWLIEKNQEVFIKSDKAKEKDEQQTDKTPNNKQRTIKDIIDDCDRSLKNKYFEIIVVGRVKVGKSTFLNALLGTEIFKNDLSACTSRVTEIIYNEKITVYEVPQDHSEIQISELMKLQPVEKREKVDNIETLWEKMTQRDEKQDCKTNPRVQVTLNHPLLRNGLVLVDTPGLGEMMRNDRAKKNAEKKSDKEDEKSPVVMSEGMKLAFKRAKNSGIIIVLLNSGEEFSEAVRIRNYVLITS